MKIAYCIGFLGKPGGTESVLVNKANYLSERLNYDVHIIIIDQKAVPIYYSLSNKITVHDIALNRLINGIKIPGLTFIKMIFSLRKIYEKKFKEINPDVIIVVERGYHDYVIPYTAKGVPKVREFHFSKGAVRSRAKIIKPWMASLRYRILYHSLYRQFAKYDRLVLLTEKDQKEGKYKTPNTIVIENMLNTIPSLQANPQNKSVISVGSMYDDRKGFHKQILIWREVLKKHPDWTLNIYGDGPRKIQLQALVSKYNLDSKVFLRGKTDKIFEKMAESSIFIMTSEAEGLPMVLIEAMSCGLPCISYDCPTGPSDIITDGVDGYLVELNDENAFIQRLDHLIENVDIRVEMSTNAQKKSMRFHKDIVMQKWIGLFDQLKEKQ